MVSVGERLTQPLTPPLCFKDSIKRRLHPVVFTLESTVKPLVEGNATKLGFARLPQLCLVLLDQVLGLPAREGQKHFLSACLQLPVDNRQSPGNSAPQ